MTHWNRQCPGLKVVGCCRSPGDGANVLSGPGAIVGVDNGNAPSIESYKGTSRQAFSGKCLAIVRSSGAAGAIVVNANGTTNGSVSQGKPASADSSEAANPPANGNDGNTSTRWCAADGNLNHWWKVDLGAATAMTGSEVTWEFARNYKYKVEVSTDNTNWTLVVDKTNTTSASQVQTDNFNATARYVRITITGLPAIVVPAGLNADGMPIAIEFLGRPFSEPKLIQVAYAYEKASRRRVAPKSAPHLSACSPA